MASSLAKRALGKSADGMRIDRFQRRMLSLATMIQTIVERDAMQPCGERTFAWIKAIQRFMHGQEDLLERILGFGGIVENKISSLVHEILVLLEQGGKSSSVIGLSTLDELQGCFQIIFFHRDTIHDWTAESSVKDENPKISINW